MTKKIKKNYTIQSKDIVKVKEEVTYVSFNNPVKEGMLFGVGFIIALILILVLWELIKAFSLATVLV